MKISQINLFGKQAKTMFQFLFSFLGWVLLFLVLWFRGCQSSPSVASSNKIVVPEVNGNFEASKPTHTEIKISEIGQNLSKKELSKNDKSKEIAELKYRIQGYKEEIELLQDDFNYSDSLHKTELYKKATKLQNFNRKFEDENVYIDINGIVQGEVKEVGAKYYIKEKTIETPKQKEVKFRLLAGAGLGNSLTFDKPLFNANLGFQNTKGNILRFSFDTQDRIMVGYDFSLFKINK